MLHKRITGLFLAFVIVFSLLPFGVRGDSALTISQEGLNLLKKEEGFSRKPYWDYAQWTVGYGTKCPDDKLEEYQKNGIPEAEAEALLRSFINRFASAINQFAAQNGLKLTQNQFDALMLFSYNCGTGWMYSKTGTLYNAVVSGATGNQLIHAFTLWCNAGGEIKTFLLRRRLSEANIYLNGKYSQTPPENFCYTLYDACGGKASPNVQGYDASLTAAILPTPTYAGYTFKGWYTAKTGGTRVEKLDSSTKSARLYARWVSVSQPEEEATPQQGVTVTVTTDGLNVRKGPGTNYQSIQKINTGTVLVITETAKGGSYTWGKCNLGWVCLQYTNYDAVTKPEAKPQTGTVKVDGGGQLRIRKGPGTSYDVAGYLNSGDKVSIVQTQKSGTMLWGKIDKGWISMSYVVLDTQEPEVEPQTGTVKVDGGGQLRIRKGPGTSYDIAGYLNSGDKVSILQTQKNGTMLWGKIDKGWVSMNYIVLGAQEPEPPATTPVQTGTVKVSGQLWIRSGPGTNHEIVGFLNNGARVSVTETAKGGNLNWGKIDKGWICLSYVVMDTQAQTTVTGTVKVDGQLRIRKGPGTSYDVAGYLNNGTKVTILEQKTLGSAVWGRIDKGWISLYYVVLDIQKPQPVVKTVTTDGLRIRSGPGTTNKIVGYLNKNDKVEILETQKVGSAQWGKTSKGWISLAYTK